MMVAYDSYVGNEKMFTSTIMKLTTSNVPTFELWNFQYITHIWKFGKFKDYIPSSIKNLHNILLFKHEMCLERCNQVCVNIDLLM